MTDERPVDSAVWIAGAVVLLVLVATRLVIALDPRQLLTGDECVVALMGLHLREGRLASGYFYGQHYGFAALEALCCATGILLGGVHTVPIKLAMLLLFIPATACLWRAIAALTDWRRATLWTLVWTALPGWTMWSLQARGGYLTGLLGATSAMMWMAVGPGRRPWIAGIGLCLSLVLVVLGQMSWLAGLLPMAIGVAWVRRQWRFLGVTALAAAAVSVVAHAWLRTLTPSSWPPPPLDPLRLFTATAALPERAWELLFTNAMAGFSGTSYLLAGVPLAMLIVLGLVNHGVRVGRRAWFPPAHILLIAAAGQAAGCLCLPAESRYLLPVLPWLVVWLAVEVSNPAFSVAWHLRAVATLAAAVLLFGVVGVFACHPMPWARETSGDERMHAFIETLTSEDVSAAYSLDPLLQWQIMFYSEEQILSRWTKLDERLPWIVREVDHRFATGEPTVLVGPGGWSNSLDPPLEGNRYAYEGLPFEFIASPNEELLRRLGFEMEK